VLQLVKNLNLSVYFKHHEINKIERSSDRIVSKQSIRVVQSSLTDFSSKKLNFKHTAFKMSSLKKKKILVSMTNTNVLSLFMKIIHNYSDIRKLICLHTLCAHTAEYP